MNIFRNKSTVQKNTEYFSTPYYTQRGFSFVELIITAAIMSLVFGGLFASFQVMTSLIGTSKAKAGALSLMTEKMEYIRSLPYNSIGTDGGVPSGPIAQNSTSTLNGIVYSERVLIQYVDDASDGIGGADTNAILADYKQIKVEYSWSMRGKSDTAALVSNVVPTGIESTAGGGTIKVHVFDATIVPVAGAEVRFVNNTTTTTIDTLRYTDASGVTYLSGAPAAANYEITVTDAGYSTDGTYTATTTNPVPATPPIAVLESQISTMNFQIDKLSDLVIMTVGTPTYGNFSDTFPDSLQLATTSSTTLVAGSLVLQGGAGAYVVTGSAMSTSTAPATLDSWYSLTFQSSTSASTTAVVSVAYNDGSSMVLIPDADLAGNSSGFSSSPIDLSTLNTGVYTELALQTTLTSLDVNQTPELHQWGLTYISSQAPIAGVGLSLDGAKTIGTDGASQPVLKYSVTGTTDGGGQWTQNDIEWDVYTVEVTSGGYSVYEVCPASPYSLEPDVSQTMKITLGGATAQLLRVLVTQVDGTVIPDATVRLQNTGVDQLQKTSVCGQTYFDSGLYNDSDYLLTVSATGYVTQAVASTTVSSSSTATVILN